MLFPTHLVAAYLVGNRWDLSPFLVVAGAAIPDLVDKPLASAGLVSLYHTVGHSLLLFLAMSLVVLVRKEWVALWVGWTSHLLLDSLHMIVNGRPEDLWFLAWPAVSHTPAVHLPPLDFLFHYLGTPSFYLEIAIWIVFAYVLSTDDGVE